MQRTIKFFIFRTNTSLLWTVLRSSVLKKILNLMCYSEIKNLGIFDRFFPKTCPILEVYENTCAHLIPSVINGYNACVLAYGTTGSGKTFTITGSIQSPGIMVLIL